MNRSSRPDNEVNSPLMWAAGAFVMLVGCFVAIVVGVAGMIAWAARTAFDWRTPAKD